MKQKAFNLLITQINMGLKQRRPFIFSPFSVKSVTFLKLLLLQGLILGFFKASTYKPTLCIFIKYWDNDSLIKALKFFNSHKGKGLTNAQLKGDIGSQGLVVISSNVGGLMICDNYNVLDYNNIRIGGQLIAKVEF